MTDLPQGWREVALGEEAQVISGATPKTTVSEYWGGDIAWLTPDDLSRNKSKVVSGGGRFLTEAGYKSCSTRIVPKGSVLFTSRAPIGYVAIAGGDICTNQGFKSAIPSSSLISDFLYYFLQFATPEIKSRASGTTFLEISAKGFAATPVALPPLAEQERIVEILEEQFSRLDSALASVKAVREKAKAFRRSLLRSLTSEATHFAEPSNVAKVALSEVGKWGGGGTPSKANKSFWNEGDIPWVTSKDMKWSVLVDSEMHITDEAVKGSSTRLVPANSVAIVARSGILEHTLPVALVPFPSTYNQDLKVVTPLSNVSPMWLLYSLQANGQEILDGCRKAGTTVASIEFPLFLRYEILLPSLKEQNRLVGIIEEQLSRLDKALEVANQLEARIASEHRSLLHSAFTGALTATWRLNND